MSAVTTDELADELKRTGDFQRAKRDLIARAVRRGYVTMDEIRRSLPPKYTNKAEMDLLLFSLEALGVDVRSTPESR